MNKILLLILISVLSGPVHAEEIKVCIDPYPPFKIVNSLGEVTGGIDIDLTNTLLNAMDIKASYHVYPWARCLNNLKNGKCDFVSGITRNTEREEYLHYIEPPYKTNSVKVFYVNRGDEGKLKTYNDIKNSNVGILRGAKYFERFDADSEIEKREVFSELAGFQMLKLRRFDAFITTEEVGDHIIETNEFGETFDKAQYNYSQDVSVYFALSKKSKFANRLPEFAKVVKKLKEKGGFIYK